MCSPDCCQQFWAILNSLTIRQGGSRLTYFGPPQVGWLSSELLNSLSQPSPALGFQGTYTVLGFLLGFWRSKLRSPCLQVRLVNNWAVFLALDTQILLSLFLGQEQCVHGIWRQHWKPQDACEVVRAKWGYFPELIRKKDSGHLKSYGSASKK